MTRAAFSSEKKGRIISKFTIVSLSFFLAVAKSLFLVFWFGCLSYRLLHKTASWYDIVFPQVEQSERQTERQTDTERERERERERRWKTKSFYNLNWEWHSIIFATFYWFKASHKVQPTFKGMWDINIEGGFWGPIV